MTGVQTCALPILRDVSAKPLLKGKKKLLMLLGLGVFLIAGLYLNLMAVIGLSGSSTDIPIGVSARSMAVANLLQAVGVLNFVFLTCLFTSIGIYIRLAPVSSDGIVALNQIMHGKQKGLKAVMKKEALSEEDVVKESSLRYRILLCPPLGKPIQTGQLISRILSVLALSMSIGLYVFTYLGNVFFPIDGITGFTSISDPNLIIYISAIF